MALIVACAPAVRKKAEMARAKQGKKKGAGSNVSPAQRTKRRLRPSTERIRIRREELEKNTKKFGVQGCAAILKGIPKANRSLALKPHLEALFEHKYHYEQRLKKEKISAHKAKVTEALGEIAATQYMKHYYPKARLVYGFAPGVGFDQIWAEYDAQNNETEIIIVEAKGLKAKLSTGAAKGDQMDVRWVTNSVLALKPKTKAEQVFKAKMLNALRGKQGAPKLSGKVIGIVKGAGRKSSHCQTKNSFRWTVFTTDFIASDKAKSMTEEFVFCLAQERLLPSMLFGADLTQRLTAIITAIEASGTEVGACNVSVESFVAAFEQFGTALGVGDKLAQAAVANSPHELLPDDDLDWRMGFFGEETVAILSDAIKEHRDDIAALDRSSPETKAIRDLFLAACEEADASGQAIVIIHNG
ncbi:hypothetical protein [Erythrobacter sp. JK5]|uniref:hypothetical protein n=1 Tax=Erythrobacter sp. JK5 TaxID=2829500 RepID=UPI001BA9F165|nr:hypothetical protein [Erythrobacter sp. JK5]QUL38366.1 hypothetical protein KDC96_02825 [Erythrobacter sp. JK5]